VDSPSFSYINILYPDVAGKTNASVAAVAYVKDNVVVVKLTENENDVPSAKLRSSTVEDLPQRDQ